MKIKSILTQVNASAFLMVLVFIHGHRVHSIESLLSFHESQHGSPKMMAKDMEYIKSICPKFPETNQHKDFSEH